MNYEDFRRLLKNKRLPAVVVDLEAFDRNVAKAASFLQNPGESRTLRLASKSLRVPRLIRRILDFGPPYLGIMAYSAEEALFLHEQGFDDILVAYPTLQASDLEALKKAHAAGAVVRLMVDSSHGIETADRFMTGLDKPFPLVVDVDMSLRPAGGLLHLGVRRSPVRTADDVLHLFREAAGRPHVRLVGLMGYEAQVAGLGDRNPFKKMMNPLAGLVRKKSAVSIYDRRRELAETLGREGFALELFNGGGAGSLDITAREPWLTELTAGSGFLCGHLFDYFSNITFEPACFFALQTVRSSDRGFVTCQGGGYIASGEPGWDKVPRPWLPEGLELLGAEGCGEVQTPLRLPAGLALEPGDPVLFRHAKAGEPAERFTEYLLVEKGEITARAPTYRGLGRCFY